MRKIYLCIICCILGVLCGCDSQENQNALVNYEDIESLPENMDYGDTAYNIETDNQYYFDFSAGRCTASNTGFYYFERKGTTQWLNFIDKDNLKSLPVCSRVDCMHNSSNCDACIDIWLIVLSIIREVYIRCFVNQFLVRILLLHIVCTRLVLMAVSEKRYVN